MVNVQNTDSIMEIFDINKTGALEINEWYVATIPSTEVFID